MPAAKGNRAAVDCMVIRACLEFPKASSAMAQIIL